MDKGSLKKAAEALVVEWRERAKKFDEMDKKLTRGGTSIVSVMMSTYENCARAVEQDLLRKG